MKFKKIEGEVVVPRWEHFNPNFFYLLGHDIDHCIAHINNGELTVYTTALNSRLCRKLFGNVVVFSSIGEIKKQLGKRCLIDADYVPCSFYRRLRVRGMRILDDRIRRMREVKENNEIEKMRKGRNIATGIIENMRVVGKNEDDIRNRTAVEMAKRGVKEAFGTIVANSRNARFPHYFRGNSKIRDYALIDMGVRCGHYNSDVTRCVGKLGEMRRVYEKLQNAVDEISDEAHAGREIGEFVEKAGAIIERNRLKPFPHSIGHGIGLEVHELPFMGKKSKEVLKENSVITIEPGQYEKKGLRYEDMFVVGKKRAKLL